MGGGVPCTVGFSRANLLPRRLSFRGTLARRPTDSPCNEALRQSSNSMRLSRSIRLAKFRSNQANWVESIAVDWDLEIETLRARRTPKKKPFQTTNRTKKFFAPFFFSPIDKLHFWNTHCQCGRFLAKPDGPKFDTNEHIVSRRNRIHTDFLSPIRDNLGSI